MVSKMGSLGEIEEYLYSLSEGEQQNYINLLKDDKRKSIQKLVQKYQSKFKKLAERKTAKNVGLRKIFSPKLQLYCWY